MFRRNLKRDLVKFTVTPPSLSILRGLKRLHSLDSWRYRTWKKKKRRRQIDEISKNNDLSFPIRQTKFVYLDNAFVITRNVLKSLFEVISLEKKISTLNVTPRKLALVHFNFTASQSKSIDSGVGLNNDKNDVQSCLKNYTYA